MAMANKVVLEGRLTRRPVRISGGTISQVMFEMRTSEVLIDRYTMKEKTVSETHQCIAWGEIADAVETRCQKGSGVRVEGRIENISKYIGRRAVKFSRIEATQGVTVLARAGQTSSGAACSTSEPDAVQ